MLKKTFLSLCGILAAGPALANIDIVFDYGYDTNGFFSDPLRRSLMDAAATVFESRFQDDLAAIQSFGANHFDINFFGPADDSHTVFIDDYSIAAGQVRIYVGGAALAGGALGQGGPGGYAIRGTPDYVNNAPSRGQGDVSGADAVDFATWGGSISFDSDSSWYFDPNGVDTKEPFAGQYDFYSVALHEIAHVLGFATADSWINKVSGDSFTGAASCAVNNGCPTLNTGRDHWVNGTMSAVMGIAQQAAMDPSIGPNTRKYFTDLDYAAMQDIGWQVTAIPEPQTWALLLAGLGLVGVAVRRRAGC